MNRSLVVLLVTAVTLGVQWLSAAYSVDQNWTFVYFAGTATIAAVCMCLLVARNVPMRIELDLTVRVRFLLRTLEFDRAEVESIGVEHATAILLRLLFIPLVTYNYRRVRIRSRDGREFQFRIDSDGERVLRSLSVSGNEGASHDVVDETDVG